MIYQADTIPVEAPVANAKPFIKWVGGKTQLLPALSSRLPRDFAPAKTTYIEPFVGGGALLFWSFSQNIHFKKVIVNDANAALINAYKIVRDCPQELIARLNAIKAEYLSMDNEEERKAYYYGKRSAYNSAAKTNVECAALFIFLNRTCFNGLYRVNAKGHFNVPHGRYANPMICDPITIACDGRALAEVEIVNGDFAEVLRSADKHTFVYLDPPYRPLSQTSCFCNYCENGFTDDEQRRLADCCRKLNRRGCRWLLSNSNPKVSCPDDDFFNSLYDGFNIQSVQANRMLNSNPNKRGKLGELLISNY